MDYQIKPLGQHRGNARLWFETTALNDVGLSAGTRYTLITTLWGIVLRPDSDGERVVSSKTKSGSVIPIIDINSTKSLGPVGNCEAVKVVFDKQAKELRISKPTSEELAAGRTGRLRKAVASMALTVAALCFGGGVMDHAAAQGLQSEGFSTALAAAVEIDGDLLEHARQHSGVVKADTKLYAAPMQELVQDKLAMQELPVVDVLVTGIPCSGASISGKSKLGLNFAEDHPEVGHLVVPYLMLVGAFQPSVAVVECVTRYSQTASAQIMRQMFRDMGYTTQEVTLNAWDFGSLEARERWFLVAATKGLQIDLAGLVPTVVVRPVLGSVLDPDVPLDRYSTMEGLKAKEVRDIEAGKGFKMQVLGPLATKVGVIGRDYTKNRSTEPKVAHPSDPSLLRLLTPQEHARIKDYPVACLGELPATRAHQLLGQSVDCRPVRALFQRIAKSLKVWDGGAGAPLYRPGVSA